MLNALSAAFRERLRLWYNAGTRTGEHVENDAMPTLREARVGRLLSIRRLAELARLSPNTVHLVETGRRLPHYGTIAKLARVLEVEPGEIDEFRMAIEDATEGKDAA